MNPERKRRLERLFDAALDLEPDQREPFIARECAGDAELRNAALRLLAAHDRAEGILEEPAEALSQLLEEAGATPRLDHAGPYRLIREIGRGGMGAVFLGERDDGQFRQIVAVKLIRPGFDAADLVRRFLAERQILASLQHPNIAHLLDGGVADDGRPYFVLEHVDGEPLDVYCDRRALDLDARLRLFCEVARAVHYAHRNLIVHRDLKPSNILVTNEGDPKLLDFGIAKLVEEEGDQSESLTRTGHLLMTPEYASPEQIRGDPITTATDIYGLGLILFEILSGQRPFGLSGRSAGEIERLICETDAPRLTSAVRQVRTTGKEGRATALPEEIARARRTTPERLEREVRGDLDRIVAAALRKEPERRYPSAEALATDIERYLDGQPVWARGESAAYRTAKFLRRHRWPVAVAAGFLLLLTGYAATLTVQGRQIRLALEDARQERDQAEEVTDFMISLFEASDPGESRGDSITARELLARGLERAESLDGQPLVQAEMLEVIGRVFTSLAEYARAEPLIRRALAINEEELGPDAAEVAHNLDALSDLLRLRGDYAAADTALRRALEINRALAGEESIDFAKNLHDLAVVLADQGEYGAAEPLHVQALEVRRRLLEPDDAAIAESLGGLAFLALQGGRYDEAESLYRESLELRRDALGETHPDVALTMNNLASVLVRRGEYAEAEGLQREALAARRRLYGDEHPRIATSLNNLAQVRMLQGDYQDADSLLRIVVDMRARLLGEEHPSYATSLNNLAFINYRQGNYGVAEPLYRQVVDLNRRVLGDGHPNTPGVMHNLALVLRATGRLEEAEEALREAQELRRAIFDGDHPEIAMGLHELGEILRDRGDLSGAEEVLREAVEMRRRLFGDDHEDTRESAQALAETTAAIR